MNIVDIANSYIEYHNKEADGIIEQIRTGQHKEAWRNRLKWIRSLDDGYILRALTRHIIDSRLHMAQSVRVLAQTLMHRQLHALFETNLNELACAVQAIREYYHKG